MGSGAVDSSQWLSVKEETIFLHDGLIRVTDLAELPSEIGVTEQGESEQEVCIHHSGFLRLASNLISLTPKLTRPARIANILQKHACQIAAC